MKVKSPLSWFGSDSEVAQDLAAMLDHCKHVTIPFCGGLSILPHLKARAIVANDLHEHAINFYRVLSGLEGPESRRDLISCCEHTLSHPGDLRRANQFLQSELCIDRAWAFWTLCWLCRKGKGGTKHQGGMPSVRRTANGGTNASRIRAAADDLAGWAKQFERCEWESIDFRDLLPKVADRPDCGVYCDPPWVGAGRDYLHSFTREDHEDLSRFLSRFEKTAVVIRYGDAPLIRALYEGWRIIDASSRTQTNAEVDEVWITNQGEKH